MSIRGRRPRRSGEDGHIGGREDARTLSLCTFAAGGEGSGAGYRLDNGQVVHVRLLGSCGFSSRDRVVYIP